MRAVAGLPQVPKSPAFVCSGTAGTFGLCAVRNPCLGLASSGMLRRVAVVRIDVSEELSASFIRVTRIGEI
jgi:hypothetical protein